MDSFFIENNSYIISSCYYCNLLSWNKTENSRFYLLFFSIGSREGVYLYLCDYIQIFHIIIIIFSLFLSVLHLSPPFCGILISLFVSHILDQPFHIHLESALLWLHISLPRELVFQIFLVFLFLFAYPNFQLVHRQQSF